MQKIEVGSEETVSSNLVQEKINQLLELFPEAVKEDKVDFESLRQVLGDNVEERDERYGLTWPGKRQARQAALTVSSGTLRPCQAESVNWNSTNNLIIEGDNLEVMKLLRKSYHAKVKMIYIDPPYNTGGDFIYPDNFAESLATYLDYTNQVDDNGKKYTTNPESGGRFHSRWLSMMYPRLFLAKNLLNEKGVIFVSIGDNEVANLRLIMDEIFGPENFVTIIAWQKVFAKKNKALISGSHDHILVYSRNILTWTRNLLPRDEMQLKAFKNPDKDARGDWQSVSFSVTTEDAEKRKAYRYPIALPSGRVVNPPTGRHWNGLEDRYQEMLADNRFWFGEAGDNPPREKVFLSEVQEGIVPDTWWKHEEAGNNQDAKKEILELFGDEEPFSTPKPTKLIKRMLQIATQPDTDDIVMDFFAGSGTTGDAVLDLNQTDGGNRKFILVQLPEPTHKKSFPTIASICAERIRKAIGRIEKKANSELPAVEKQKQDHGFRYFRLDSSNIRAWIPDVNDLPATLFESIEHLNTERSEDDILYELLLKWGLPLDVPIEMKEIANKKVCSIGSGVLLVCLANKILSSEVEELGLGIGGWYSELGPSGETTCIFKDSAFADDVAKTNLSAILEQSSEKERVVVRSL